MASSPSSALWSSECRGSFTSIFQLRSPRVTLGFYPVVMEMPTFLFSTSSAGCFPNCSCQWYWCLLGDCLISSLFSFCPLIFRKYNFSLYHSCLVSGWQEVLVQYISLFSASIRECQVPGCSKRMGSYCYNGIPDSRGGSKRVDTCLDSGSKSWEAQEHALTWEELHKNTSRPRILILFHSIPILWGVILTEHPS